MPSPLSRLRIGRAGSRALAFQRYFSAVKGLADIFDTVPELLHLNGAVSGGGDAQQQFAVLLKETGRADDLAMAFVHAFRQQQKKSQGANFRAHVLVQFGIERRLSGGTFAMEIGQRGQQLHFARRESQQFRIADQVVAVDIVA